MAEKNLKDVDGIELSQQKSKGEDWEPPALEIFYLPDDTLSGASADSESNGGLFS